MWVGSLVKMHSSEFDLRHSDSDSDSDSDSSPFSNYIMIRSIYYQKQIIIIKISGI